ncbi:hypothetical protein GGS20DRAFT_335202 [Poronia punctata]|nr:hypothetical protein GGS20DRAFT_335202 [Poronia punctata]
MPRGLNPGLRTQRKKSSAGASAETTKTSPRETEIQSIRGRGPQQSEKQLTPRGGDSKEFKTGTIVNSTLRDQLPRQPIRNYFISREHGGIDRKKRIEQKGRERMPKRNMRNPKQSKQPNKTKHSYARVAQFLNPPAALTQNTRKSRSLPSHRRRRIAEAGAMRREERGVSLLEGSTRRDQTQSIEFVPSSYKSNGVSDVGKSDSIKTSRSDRALNFLSVANSVFIVLTYYRKAAGENKEAFVT